MAEKFGGRYSPGATAPGAAPAAAPKPVKPGFRSNVLFVLPFLFAWRAFRGEPVELIAGLGTFAVLMLAAWLTRDGILAHAAYDARRVAKRPAIPRKVFGAVLTGAGLGLATALSGQSLLIAIGIGAIGAVLHLAAFGPDPMADKGAEGIDAFQTGRVAQAVDEAERMLAGMADAILRAGDRKLEGRIDRFAATARAMFRTVESDPRDLTAARKYLGVYLLGARDATVKFADLYAQTRDATARADYEKLLDDLETTFADRTRAFIAGGKTDLDVEIEVLRERLAQKS